MTTSQIKVQSKLTELTTQSLRAFCKEISGTFGVIMKCRKQKMTTETVASLQERFNKLLAVNTMDSEGPLSGTFQFILDQDGLFTLGGIIVMLSEERIMSNRQNASPGLSESMIDAIGEIGNLLVGSWDRIFREGLQGHNRFTHRLPAFVGRWDKAEETMDLTADDEILFIPYKMTVGSYPVFSCGVVFPKTIFGDNSDFKPEETTVTEQNTQKQTQENTPEMQTETEKTDTEESDKESDNVQASSAKKSKQEQPSVEETPTQTTDDGEIQEQAQTEQVPEETADAENAAPEASKAEESKQEQPSVEETPAQTTDDGEIQEQAQAEQVPEETADAENAAPEPSNGEESKLQQPDVPPEQKDKAPESNTANDVAEDIASAHKASENPPTGNIFQATRKITESPAILPGQSLTTKKEKHKDTVNLFEISANDIMQNQLTWASPDNSLQQALAKMQQTDAGYIMIGQNGVLEGIVSKSDITRAMSPYLQPIFAKWRRPLDDATLKIRIKWIMSRPVRTVKPETSLAAIMEYMSQFRGRCVPVTDDAGNVQGLVTAFDIFTALLKSNSNSPAEGQTAEVLVESTTPVGTA